MERAEGGRGGLEGRGLCWGLAALEGRMLHSRGFIDPEIQPRSIPRTGQRCPGERQAAGQGLRVRLWLMDHPVCPAPGLGGGLGGGRCAQRGGLVPSPGAGL